MDEKGKKVEEEQAIPWLDGKVLEGVSSGYASVLRRNLGIDHPCPHPDDDDDDVGG